METVKPLIGIGSEESQRGVFECQKDDESQV